MLAINATLLAYVLPALLVIQITLAIVRFVIWKRIRKEVDDFSESSSRPTSCSGSYRVPTILLMPPSDGLEGEFPEGQELPESAQEVIRGSFESIRQNRRKGDGF
jgi:hypothetical protein